MKQKRWIEKTLAVVIMVVMVFSSLNIGSVSAADSKSPTGNPVPQDGTLPAILKTNRSDFRNIQPDQEVTVMIQLKDQPLSKYEGGVKGLQATSNKATGAKKLSTETTASKSYMSYLVGKQEQFKTKLQSALPHVKVDRQYQVVLNAVSAKIKGADLQKLLAMPEVVYVSAAKEHTLDMYTSIPLIGLGSGNLGYPTEWTNAGLWATLGGPQNAGKGIRIADIDSGITPDHPCFSGAGYLYPMGFPRGEKTITNGKIIAAYSYFRADDPPYYPATARDDPGVAEGGHGTHTAGTMACNYGTPVPYNNEEGNPILISGVAPKAQLMIYRVFYESVSGSHSAWTPELVAAIEQAVKDGADVVNNSWGGTHTDALDAETVAYNAAVQAGLIVVFSAGNEGDTGNSSIGSPGTGDQFITVGATNTKMMTFISTVTAVSRSDGEVVDPFTADGWGPLTTDVTGEMIALEQIPDYTDVIGCYGAFPSEYVAGKIVVVRRGTCPFVDKAANAAAGGAIGIVVYNADGGNTNLNVVKGVVPIVTIKNDDGHSLLNYLAALPVGVTVTMNLSAGVAAPDDITKTDMLASFSSRGPNFDLSIKPDLTAPGVNILSSVSPMEEGGTPDFDFYQGTSMAAPHVTGAAALLAQIHPTWKQEEVKSALMTTAKESVMTLDNGGNPVAELNPTQRGSGRLDLTAPDKVGVTFDHPSLSYRAMTSGVASTIEVDLKNQTAIDITYDVSAIDTSVTGVTPVMMVDAAPATQVTVPAHGVKSVDFEFTPVTVGQNFGEIKFTDILANDVNTAASATPELHIPYFAHVNAAVPAADVLLMDDTLSSSDSCPNVISVYEDAITNAGYSYNLYDVGANGYYMNFEEAYKPGYKFVVIATGNCGAFYDLSWFGNQMRDYVSQGGKVVLFGPDAVYIDYLLVYGYGSPYTFNPELMFAASLAQDDLFHSLPVPVPTMAGDKTQSEFMTGEVFTLDTSLNSYIDEYNLVSYSDMDQLPLLKTNAITAVGDGLLGTARFSDPSIERVKKKEMWTRMSGRTAVFSFGLEAVTADGNTAADLLIRTFQFMEDQPVAGFTRPAFYAAPGKNMTLTAGSLLSFSNPDELNSQQYQNRAIYYRYDFGDGTPVQYGGTSIVHQYAKLGTYKAYVEVMDGFGHRAVSEPVTVNVVTAPPKPVNLVAAGLTTPTPTLKWTKQAKSTLYYVEVYSYKQARTVYTTYVDAATSCTGTVCSIKTPALANGKYYFKVRAYVGDIAGPFSAIKIFTVAVKLAK